MRKNDLNCSDNNISASLENDVLDRNKLLINFIRLLISIDDNYTISIDGEWGSGKTFFIKQLLYLHSHQTPQNIINKSSNADHVIEEFKEKYIPIYYNAWEHDDDIDPLESIICHILTDDSSDAFNESMSKKAANDTLKTFINKLVYNYINKKTGGIVDEVKSSIKHTSSTYENCIKTVKEIKQKKELIDKLFNLYIPEGKRLLLIVDDLDRSRPDYSVKLLEVLKHFYGDNRITTLITTNNRQLAHSIEHFYGNETDGYKYLNRIYDTTIILKVDNIKEYTKTYHGLLGEKDYAIEQLMVFICEYFNFSYREINRYATTYKIVKKYTQIGDIFSSKCNTLLLSSAMMFALALRIKDIAKYNYFISYNWELSGFNKFLSDLYEKEDQNTLFSWLYNLAVHDEPTDNTAHSSYKIMTDVIIKKLEKLVENKDKQRFTFDLNEALSLISPTADYNSTLPIDEKKLLN